MIGGRGEDDPDSQNVVLWAIQTPKVKDILVDVANPCNRDPLDLDRDSTRDVALKLMQDQRCRRESRSSSAGSRSSNSKHHRSGSRSKDKVDSKKGHQMPMEDRTCPAPVEGIHRPTLDWSQDILEPGKP